MTTPLCALVTRPRGDAEAVAGLLRERGIAVMIAPLITISRVAGARVETQGIQGFLLTSANGARALAAATAERALPVFAVGDATARAARGLGFAEVASAGGNVDDLARLVCAQADPGAGGLLHAAGSAVAGDLAGRLGAAGFDVRRAVLYRARKRGALAPEVVAQLRAGGIDLALFFSPRTAATFVTLAHKAAVAAACRKVTAFCLSPAVAEAAAGLTWRRLCQAARPELSALMDQIDSALAKGGLAEDSLAEDGRAESGQAGRAGSGMAPKGSHRGTRS